MNISKVCNQPTINDDVHGSIYRLYHILNKVLALLKAGTPTTVIFEIVDDIQAMTIDQVKDSCRGGRRTATEAEAKQIVADYFKPFRKDGPVKKSENESNTERAHRIAMNNERTVPCNLVGMSIQQAKDKAIEKMDKHNQTYSHVGYCIAYTSSLIDHISTKEKTEKNAKDAEDNDGIPRIVCRISW